MKVADDWMDPETRAALVRQGVDPERVLGIASPPKRFTGSYDCRQFGHCYRNDGSCVYCCRPWYVRMWARVRRG